MEDYIKDLILKLLTFIACIAIFTLLMVLLSKDAEAQSKNQLSYAPISATKADDGSITATVYFNIYGNGQIQTVNFAPATQLSDIQIGLTNYAQMLYKKQQDSIASISIFNSFILQTDTTILSTK